MAEVGQFDFKLNQVCERFFTVGTWKSMWRKMNLASYSGIVTLPRGVDTCRQIRPCFGLAFPLYSQFHRGAGWGACCDSLSLANCGAGATLIDENAQTFRIPTGTYKLRAVATEAADPGLTLMGGFDGDGNEIFGTEALVLMNGTSNGTTTYTGLPYIRKAVTAGAVLLYSVDTTTAEATLIASYAPGETIPEYRQYSSGFTSSEDDPQTVRAICKLGLVLAVSADDLVIPGHIGALKLGLMALQFEDKVDPANAKIYMQDAIDLLDSELRELDAAEQPLFSVSPNFGCGSIPNVR